VFRIWGMTCSLAGLLEVWRDLSRISLRKSAPGGTFAYLLVAEYWLLAIVGFTSKDPWRASGLIRSVADGVVRCKL
jgi:hypothetical protein